MPDMTPNSAVTPITAISGLPLVRKSAATEPSTISAAAPISGTRTST